MRKLILILLCLSVVGCMSNRIPMKGKNKDQFLLDHNSEGTYKYVPNYPYTEVE